MLDWALEGPGLLRGTQKYEGVNLGACLALPRWCLCFCFTVKSQAPTTPGKQFLGSHSLPEVGWTLDSVPLNHKQDGTAKAHEHQLL